MSSSKKIDLVRNFAAGVYQIFWTVMLVFSTQLCELLPPLTFSLVQISLLPPV
jgi:hypothetical protein